MRSIGADLHKKSITFCVVEIVAGKVRVVARERLLCREVGKIRQFLRKHQRCEVAVEATGAFDWFVALAEPLAARVVLVHPRKLRIIAESTRKTDKIDAHVLAEFLARDMLPEAWRPTPRVRAHRSLVRRRQKIQSRITSIKNTIRGILTRNNADRQNLFSKLGRAAVKRLKLREVERWLLDDLWEDLAEATARLAKVDARIDRFADAAPQREREARAVLATMPGSGRITIETVLAELGDWERFDNADAVVAYAGLDPKVRESDGRRLDLALSKAGSPLLRWILIQLAHRVKRTSPRWRRPFEQLAKRAGKKKATCAIARRLLLVIYAMLRDGQAYRLPAQAA
jgi:transposase